MGSPLECLAVYLLHVPFKFLRAFSMLSFSCGFPCLPPYPLFSLSTLSLHLCYWSIIPSLCFCLLPFHLSLLHPSFTSSSFFLLLPAVHLHFLCFSSLLFPHLLSFYFPSPILPTLSFPFFPSLCLNSKFTGTQAAKRTMTIDCLTWSR